MPHTATVNGVKLAYEDIGQAGDPVVLLVHGYPLSRHLWREQHAALAAAGWRGIIPDLRGHGASAVPTPPYTLDEFADDLAALLDHLGIDRVVYGGLSMGGYTAFAFWRRHRARVRRLMLVDTQAGADTPEARAGRVKAQADIRAGRSAAVVEAMLGRVLGATTQAENPRLVESARQMMAATPPQGMLGDLAALMARPDSTPLLPAIDAPTLIVVGEEDVVTPPALHEAMQRAIPGSRLVTIPRAGHLSPLEQPDAFNRAMVHFLQQVDAKR